MLKATMEQSDVKSLSEEDLRKKKAEFNKQ
jgi:hypothetical protein